MSVQHYVSGAKNDPTPVSAANPLPVTISGGGGTGGASANPIFVATGQGTVTQTTITLAAETAQTIIAANANIRGARILNWIAAPVYITNGTAGTPASGAPSDYIPAATSGPVPAQFEFAYSPVAGVRAVSATAGTLTVETW